MIFGVFAALASIGRLIEEWRSEVWINKALLLAFAVIGVVSVYTGVTGLIND